MADATLARSVQNVRLTAEAAVAVGEVRQLASGLAGVSAEPSLSLEKTSAADTFEVDVDWLRARTAKQ